MRRVKDGILHLVGLLEHRGDKPATSRAEGDNWHDDESGVPLGEFKPRRSVLTLTHLCICICLLVTQHSYKYEYTNNTFLRVKHQGNIELCKNNK